MNARIKGCGRLVIAKLMTEITDIFSCATQNAKEYVLRDEIKETSTGFILPFRAFRFKQGEAVKIECEVKYCNKCKKVRVCKCDLLIIPLISAKLLF